MESSGRIESALRASEARWHAAIRAVHGIVWTNDAQGRMTGEQPAWAELTGQSRESYQDYGWSSAVHPDDAQPTIDAWQVAVAARSEFNFEHRVRCRDGQWRLFSIRAIPVLDARGEIAEWVGVHTDITEARRAEQRDKFLSELADRMRELTSPADVMHAATTSLGRFLPVGRCGYGEVDASDEFVTIERDWTDGTMPTAAGRLRLDDFGSQLIAELRHGRTARVADALEDDRIEREAARMHVELGGTRASLSVPLIRDGRFAAVLYVHQTAPRDWSSADEALVRDVAERTWSAIERARIEQALKERERRFRLMADAAPVLIWTADTSKACDWFNRPWLEFTGRTMQQELGYGWAKDVHPDDFERCVAIYEKSFDARQPFALDYRLRRQDGEYRWVVSNGLPLYEGPNGGFSGYIGSCLDITERKSAEESLMHADRRKDEFLATLAHELRNPLAPVRQATRIARSERATGEQLNWALEVIDRQSAHMSSLLDDLLDVARITRGRLNLRKELIDLRAVVESAIETVRPLIDSKRHQLQVDLPAAAVRLNADPVRLSQILGNLLTNAAKYSDPGALISLTASQEQRELTIRIRDSGIGIAPELLPRLFVMFAQGDKALERGDGGLGIGLSLVKGLVELHGGTVAATSGGVGRGSEFIVRLPCAHEQIAPAPQPVSEPSARKSARKILVADDNRDAADSLSLLLKLDGHDVRVVHDGEAAVDTAIAFRPDLVFLDVGMPKLNGYEVARRIRAQPWGAEVKVIAITGWGQIDDRRKAIEAGFDRHFTKPVDFTELMGAVA